MRTTAKPAQEVGCLLLKGFQQCQSAGGVFIRQRAAALTSRLMMRCIAVFGDTTTMGRYDYAYDHAADPMEPDPGQTIEHAIGDVIIGFAFSFA
jgi:hypothetical protein